MTNPGSPTNLSEEQKFRTKTTVGLKWFSPAFSGGPDVIDYRILMQDKNGVFKIIEKNVATYNYEVNDLELGESYSFKVQARNIYGYGLASDTFTLLCATAPNSPSGVSTKSN